MNFYKNRPYFEAVCNKPVMLDVQAHLDEAKLYFPEDRIVGIFLQGSQNYGLDTVNSDVDTKLIVLPTFEDIAFNKQPCSTTHVRENDEHIDFKDVRLYMQTFRKQNLNFLEILFTNYKIINPAYLTGWKKLESNREAIARYNPTRSIKSMKGIALEKYHAMEHEYPSKVDVLAKFGYDPKQLHHLLRVQEYLQRYINGEEYVACLSPKDPEYLIAVKMGLYDLEKARQIGKLAIDNVVSICDNFTATHEETIDENIEKLLDEVQLNLMREGIKNTL